AYMEKDGIRIGFGIMGGWNQAQAHAQFVSNLVDFGMNIQAALDAPRFTKLSFGGCDVALESRISEVVRKELTAMGHVVTAPAPGTRCSAECPSGCARLPLPHPIATDTRTPSSDARHGSTAWRRRFQNGPSDWRSRPCT